MSTTHKKSLHLASTLFLLVWSDWNGNHSPAGVLALPALVVLGDSTVDVGVNSFEATVVRANFPPYGRDFPGHQATGRFCNGKLINDVVAELTGYPPPYQLAFNDPNAEGEIILRGINTASSGSGFWDATLTGVCVPMSTQIQWVGEWTNKVKALVGEEEGSRVVGEAIYFFATGSNDWINNYYNDPLLQKKYDKVQYTAFILEIVRKCFTDLYNFGARRIGAVSLPPLGCVPVEMDLRLTGGKCIEAFNDAATYFNGELQKLLVSIEGDLPGITTIYLDSYTQVYGAFYNPSQYGIANTNTSEVCCYSVVPPVPGFGPFCNFASPVCANADEYLWWDGFHPTQFFNQIVGELFFKTLQSELGI